MKFGSREFVELRFPEYIVGGEPLRLKTGEGRITGTLQTADTSPWKFSKPEGWEFSPNCTPVKFVNAEERPGYPAAYKTVKVDVSDAEIQAWCDSVNYFRNGGRDCYGAAGLDPKKLVGMTRAVGTDVFVGPAGKYWPNHGGYAMFKGTDGRWWRSEMRLPE